MNKILITLIVAFSVMACETAPVSDLDKLLSKRDSLQTAIKDLNIQIALIDTVNGKESAFITVEKLETGKFEHFFEVQGIVEAQNNVTIVSEIPAIIKKIHVKEGQQVKKGSLLVSLDNETVLNQIEELKTRLKLATFVYEKQKNLREENIGSELDYETAKNNKESIESSLETAESQLAKTKILAPYNGIVDDVFPREGELAGPQFPMIRFVSLGDVNIKVDVPESYLTKVKKGDQVEVKFPDLEISHFSSIYQRGSYIEPLNRTFKVMITLPKDDNLLPNLIGVVKIKDFSVDNALLIQQENIMQDAEGNDYVFKVVEEDGLMLARKVYIERGISYKNLSFVKDGLSNGDLVVSKGARSIVDGENVHWEQ